MTTYAEKWQKNIPKTPKTNMEPQNVGVEDELPFQSDDFQVRKFQLLVFGCVANMLNKRQHVT